MKIQSFRFFAFAVTAGLTFATAIAHPEEHHPQPSKHSDVQSVPLPNNKAETLAAIQNQFSLLTTALADGNLSAVSPHAVTLNQLVRHIIEQVPADHQTEAKEVASQNSIITTELTRAAAAGASKPAATIASQLSNNLRALQRLAH